MTAWRQLGPRLYETKDREGRVWRIGVHPKFKRSWAFYRVGAPEDCGLVDTLQAALRFIWTH